jgi:hypothetical protein
LKGEAGRQEGESQEMSNFRGEGRKELTEGEKETNWKRKKRTLSSIMTA